jgi:hypothetical protein
MSGHPSRPPALERGGTCAEWTLDGVAHALRCIAIAPVGPELGARQAAAHAVHLERGGIEHVDSQLSLQAALWTLHGEAFLS